MFKQSSSRIHRNRGLKVKHALQIFLLVAVCLWLLYQVKHSHDEKKAFAEINAKISEQLENRQDRLKFGRKDLIDGGQISSTQTEKNELEEEKEGEEEDDENKHEESDHDERDIDDVIDHIDEEKSEEESENREEIVDGEGHEEKEDAEEGHKENGDAEEGHEEKEDAEEVEDNNEKEVGAENTENEEQEEGEENKGNSREAREAHYNGDDASSAVVKLDLKTESENDLEKSGEERNEEYKNNSDDIDSYNNNNDLKVENKINSTLDFKIYQNNNDTVDEIQNSPLNVTGTGKKVDDVTLSEIENKVLDKTTDDTVEKDGSTQLPKIENEIPNNTTTETVEVVADAHLETSGNNTQYDSTAAESHDEIPNEGSLVGANTENVTMPVGNETIAVAPILDQNATLKIEKTSDEESPQFQSELLGVVRQQSNVTMEESRILIETNSTLEASEEQKEKLKETEGGGESDNSPMASTVDDASIVEPEESQTSMVTREVSEVLTDLETLPERDIEGQSTEDIAAE